MVEAPAIATMPFRVLLDEAFRWVRHTYRGIFWQFAVVSGSVAALLILPQTLWIRQIGEPSQGRGSGFDVAFGCIFAGGIFAAMALYLLLYATMGAVALDAVAGRPIRIGSRVAFLIGPRSLGTLLLTSFLMALSYLCCLLPALYVVPLLSFSLAAMVEEGRFGMNAVNRSVELSRYNPSRQILDLPQLKIFVLLFVGWLLSMAVSLVIQMPVSVAQQWSILRRVGEPGAVEATGELIPAWLLWIQVPAAFLSGIASTVVGLYVAFGLALLFVDTRGRKEGADLEVAIAEIDRDRGATMPDLPPPPEPPAGDLR